MKGQFFVVRLTRSAAVVAIVPGQLQPSGVSVEGDEEGSPSVEFVPAEGPISGDYYVESFGA